MATNSNISGILSEDLSEDDESGDEYQIGYNEINDPDYSECFMSGIPLSVFRLIYGLQFSTIKSRENNQDGCKITFDLSEIFVDNLMETLIWETKKCNINRSGNLITITVPYNSIIIQGLDHKNPEFPQEIWNYLEIRAKKESINVRI